MAENDGYQYEHERIYRTLLGYIYHEMEVSQLSNIHELLINLAEVNNMTLSELFRKYQG